MAFNIRNPEPEELNREDRRRLADQLEEQILGFVEGQDS